MSRMLGWLWRGVAILAVGALVLATGCQGFFIYTGNLNGGSSASSTTGDYVYVANHTALTVAGFAIGTGGTLSAVTNSPYSVPYAPTAVAVTPSDSFLYVGTASQIYGYSIGSAGELTALFSGGALAIANVAAMDISSDGNWLLVLDGNGQTIDEYLINATTGALSSASGASYSSSGATPLSIKISPNTDYVFASLGLDGDLVFSFNSSASSGLLTQESPLTLASGVTDNAVTVSPDSSTLYIARSTGSGGLLAAYTIGTNGSLTAVSGTPLAAATQPYSVVVNNAGTAVYVANRGSGTISGYGIGSGGALTQIANSPYSSGPSVTALAVDKSGDYLLAAANGGTPDLTMYSFDSATAGRLDLSTTTATGNDPTGPVALAVTH